MKLRRMLLYALAGILVGALTGCVSPGGHTWAPESETVAPGESAPPDKDWEAWDKLGPSRIRQTIGGYFRNRAYDFTDMFDVGLSFGPWARIEGQYLIGFWGFGAMDHATRIRFGGRSFVLTEENTTLSSLPFPASLILWPATLASDDEVTSAILALGGISYESEYGIWPDPVLAGLPQNLERIRITCIERDPKRHEFRVTPDSFPVGVEAHLLIGARARVMPLQIADFLAGIFGWNLLGDDIKPYRPVSMAR